MTVFDLIVIAVLLFSIGFAIIRGAVREIGTLAVLGLAIGGAALLTGPIQGLVGAKGSFIAAVVIGAALVALLFCGLYVGMHVGLARLRLTGQAAQADRIGGGVFGLLRGLVLIGLGFLAYSYYLDEQRWPDAVRKAWTLPMAKGMAGFFESLAPESTRLDGAPSGRSAPQKTPDGAPESDIEPQADAAARGYDRGERSALSEIVATVTTSDRTGEPARGAREPARRADSAGDAGDPIAAILKESDPE
ncbi:CvpA family protein [Amphiplicatus metriothermophilus]|uniref:Uncharacterized membrane protein, required for colicin V production n=1 Tax=Amphiplicatus metriothermophilus TaxID=1519374 RepID=A0A239PX07_9PROT|nr:CvpA family protein [Amphiplicatus metriothermophilus]MBB5519923.1 membrane protein required for colicin V production [Amphiplicatus metriothermophilus]SNT74824.1 Uncharacterized membrane protein, required for colicin V production [Amphiplicatus metriothermophilus]